jgi:hypothetical protein
MRNGTNPILTIEPLRLKVRWQEPVIDVENKIELPVFNQLRDATLPRMEIKMHLVAPVRILPAQTRQHDCANIVRARNEVARSSVES